MGRPWVLDSVNTLSVLEDIGRVLDRMWAAHRHVPALVRTQIGIATAEIAANILEHAGVGSPVRIRMEARVGPTDVRVEFTDDGVPAPVDIDHQGLPPEMAECGRGLAMAHAVLQTLAYRRNGMNHWTLISKPFG